MRIVSLLPAATELVFALEQRHALVGRTHECDHPPGIGDVPALTVDLLELNLEPAAVDQAVKEGVATASTIYRLDVDAFLATRPDVVITQHTCAVCAVDAEQVERAIALLDEPARILTYDPHRLDELPHEAERIGRELGDDRAGLALRSHIERRLRFVADRIEDVERLRVAVVEWPDPLFAPGHWVPDVVTAAGATSVFGTAGQRSVETEWKELEAASPEVIVLSFCGYDLPTSLRHADPIITRLAELGSPRLLAVDGSAWMSRPGPRLVDGVEALASLLHDPHPDLRPARGMAAEYVDGAWMDGAAVRV